MYRLKNVTEIMQSLKGECSLAHCHEMSTAVYDNDGYEVLVCQTHYDRLCKMKFGG